MGVNASSDTAPKWEIFSDAFTAAANEEADVAGELIRHRYANPFSFLLCCHTIE
ncbi:hypothetical protein L1525_003217 [Salmonella enterica subsp. enterica serovar Adelaide]|uniref:Uncharacterized protein n=2 Tax=Salmonella enterica TaxID=28901 RepID=A0A764JT82_SALER|nr:hypothetical protein [Salmonella enterica]EEK3249450.1 hypothetical protein [Salmonella enterica subsp. enterica]EHC35289.1 hypothetical protein LTSEADE_3015 [Salmonella enterica subsp. enterica serovar Adelaide str. A4-669]EEC6665384.1 hypothetical protein [Salmonella enterica]EEI0697682.1 hypothetical protein [Salmonella enterica]EEL1364138.1 hypothetical protein [Salmonella enterica subsp. enterica]